MLGESDDGKKSARSEQRPSGRVTERQSARLPRQRQPRGGQLAGRARRRRRPLRLRWRHPSRRKRDPDQPPTFATRTASLTVRAGAEPKAQTDHLRPRHRQQADRVGAEVPMGHGALRHQPRRPQPHGLLGQPRLLPKAGGRRPAGTPTRSPSTTRTITTAHGLALAKAQRSGRGEPDRAGDQGARGNACAGGSSCARSPKSWRRIPKLPAEAVALPPPTSTAKMLSLPPKATRPHRAGADAVAPARRQRFLLPRGAPQGDDRQPGRSAWRRAAARSSSSRTARAR